MLVIAGAGTLLLGGCSAVYQVRVDYDVNASFSRYRTYGWLSHEEDGDSSRGLIRERVKTAVDTALARKGFESVSDNPDLLIAESSWIDEIVDVRVRGSRRGYGRASRIGSYEFERQTISLTVIDAGSDLVVWRGSANAELEESNSSEQAAALISEAVSRILRYFPPAPMLETGRSK